MWWRPVTLVATRAHRHRRGKGQHQCLEQHRESRTRPRPGHTHQPHPMLAAAYSRHPSVEKRLVLKEIQVPPCLVHGVVHRTLILSASRLGTREPGTPPVGHMKIQPTPTPRRTPPDSIPPPLDQQTPTTTRPTLNRQAPRHATTKTNARPLNVHMKRPVKHAGILLPRFWPGDGVFPGELSGFRAAGCCGHSMVVSAASAGRCAGGVGVVYQSGIVAYATAMLIFADRIRRSALRRTVPHTYDEHRGPCWLIRLCVECCVGVAPVCLLSVGS